MTDSDDTEMFDQSEEDKDLDNQVKKGQTPADEAHKRSEREDTPGPQTHSDVIPDKITASPSPQTPDKAEGPGPQIKQASDGPLKDAEK